MFVVAIKGYTETVHLDRPPEYFKELEQDHKPGSRCKLTKDFLGATFYTRVEDARVGVQKVLGIVPIVSEFGRSMYEGFLVREGLHITYDRVEAEGEVGIYPVLTDGKVGIGDPVEMTHVIAQLTETNPLKASMIVGGAFRFAFKGRGKIKDVQVLPQMELFLPDWFDKIVEDAKQPTDRAVV